MESIANVKGNPESPRRRPGGRTAEVTQRIRDSVLALLLEGGVENCTMTNIADRSQVERSTLYRRYPDRWSAVIDAVIDKFQRDAPIVLTGSFAGDLKSLLTNLAAGMSTPLGPAIVAAAGALHHEGQVAAARIFFERRMEQLRPIFEAAVERGELPASADCEELFVFASGSLWFGKFIASRPIDQAAIDRIVEAVCTLYCTPAGKRAIKRWRVAGQAEQSRTSAFSHGAQPKA